MYCTIVYVYYIAGKLQSLGIDQTKIMDPNLIEKREEFREHLTLGIVRHENHVQITFKSIKIEICAL